ncbi:hypothetical protein Dsin_009037 [Dipteronia sinensis]|uniref:Reverse transcriptase domain-containing protein n=1 Tax=Dipteronia sinensis TaxID=43782 RepID=A0AAE0AR19_9ROSI|nr:hypothetical protein Dsin_009037 [Dipteronia sinensis]
MCGTVYGTIATVHRGEDCSRHCSRLFTEGRDYSRHCSGCSRGYADTIHRVTWPHCSWGSSFTDLFEAAPIQVDNVSGPSILSKKGGYVVETEFSMVEDVIPSLVTDVENDFLISIPSTDDIHDAVFAMDAASAPGPGSFSRGVIFPGLNSSFIFLLLKLKDSISIDQFRPTVLSNFLFKISSKIVADRLAQIAARIVSPHQFGFIRDRHIEDCIALASDCVNVMHKKCYRGNLAMKIDIRKAFDTLDWSFLRRVLQAFGFSPIFMNWIDSILGSSRLLVLINGSPEGYFHCSRGVCQGDHLSPILFGIAEDFLSRLLSRMVDFSQLLPISSPRGFSAPTHLLYADDVLIFYRGTVRNLKNIYFGSFVSPSGLVDCNP